LRDFEEIKNCKYKLKWALMNYFDVLEAHQRWSLYSIWLLQQYFGLYWLNIQKHPTAQVVSKY
jgi:hypothetical protein